MPLIGSALLDPATEEGDFGIGEAAFLGVGRRHRFVTSGLGDPVDELAVVWFSGNDGEESVMVLEGAFPGVEPEIGFSFFLVGAVTEEALVREDGPDIAIEDHLLCGSEGFQSDYEKEEETHHVFGFKPRIGKGAMSKGANDEIGFRLDFRRVEFQIFQTI